MVPLCGKDCHTSHLRERKALRVCSEVKKLPAERVNINRGSLWLFMTCGKVAFRVLMTGKPGSELAMHQRSIARDSEDRQKP